MHCVDVKDPIKYNIYDITHLMVCIPFWHGSTCYVKEDTSSHDRSNKYALLQNLIVSKMISLHTTSVHNIA